MKLLAAAVSLLPLLATLTHCSLAGSENAQKHSQNFQSPRTLRYRHDYCVLGAGPAGLQIAHFLEKCGRDYVVLERNHAPGSFFQRYPRHRRLISINKIHTGRSNTEFNLRHDWNSLLSDRDSLRYKHYSKEYYPHADSMLAYLKKYSTELNLRVSVVLVSTGLWVPRQVRFPGSEFLEGYESVSVDPEDFAGQAVLILGKGNSAFETASNLLGTAGHLHLYSRSPVRLAWETHYVGDLRAVNNDLLDSYQLKSLDGLVEGAVERLAVLRDGRGRLYLTLAELLRASNVSRATAEPLDTPTLMSLLPADQDDNFFLRRPYDRMVRCLGFEFDYSIFSNDTAPLPRRGPPRKYPLLTPWYETRRTPGIFIIGTASHGRDHRRSAGGFIHGFRYTVRAVHRVLEQRYHGNSWPSVSLPTSQLLGAVLRRINEASGTYQMFSVLGDIVLLQGVLFPPHSDQSQPSALLSPGLPEEARPRG